MENQQPTQIMDIHMEEPKLDQEVTFEGFTHTKNTDGIEEEDDGPMENLEEFKQEIEFEKVEVTDIGKKDEIRRIPVPPHRVTPLRNNWEKIVTTIVENMKLQIRMNTKRKCVELKTSEHTLDRNAIQKSADFLKAFMLGFDLNDAIALLRMDDLYIESFEIKDVKTLHGEHLSRCIGRISGEKGKTKFAVENATKTRIVLADTKIHILGSFSNIKIARDAVCSLILGSPPGKVYSHLRYVSKRNLEKIQKKKAYEVDLMGLSLSWIGNLIVCTNLILYNDLWLPIWIVTALLYIYTFLIFELKSNEFRLMYRQYQQNWFKYHRTNQKIY